MSLNALLAWLPWECGIPPDNSTSRELNFCEPRIFLGGAAAGLYLGDSTVAKNRCLTGNTLYKSGPAIATTTNPAVTINCRNITRPTTQPPRPTFS
ncbi:hypothetical protein ACROYT_G009905 [Oculina patagonica]